MESGNQEPIVNEGGVEVLILPTVNGFENEIGEVWGISVRKCGISCSM